MNKNISIALASINLIKADKAANLTAIERCIVENDHKNIDLFLFPELSIIGGMWKKGDNEYKNLAEPVPDGASCKIIESLAKKYQTSICTGLTEIENGQVFITHAIFTPDGFAGKQRKLFPHHPDNESVFSSGKTITPISLFDRNRNPCMRRFSSA